MLGLLMGREYNEMEIIMSRKWGWGQVKRAMIESVKFVVQ